MHPEPAHSTRRRLPFACGLLPLLIVLSPRPGQAQPSGGPYGPIPQTYALPADAAHVYYVAPDGKAEAAGTTLAEPTTLEAAIERVVTGDAIVMRGGTYRTGGLRLNQGITWQPYADERPVLKGTRVATEWTALRNNVWRTSWKTLFPAAPRDWWHRDREGMRTPLHRFNNDMVFVDGAMLQVGRLAGRARRALLLRRLRGRPGLHRHRPEGPEGRDHRVRQRLRSHERPLPRQGVGPEGADDPRAHVHAVRLPRDRHRGEEARDPRVRGADRRPRGPGRAGDVRARGRGHDARERDDLLLLARGRLLPGRRPRAAPVADQRHLDRGLLRHRLLRRAAGEEHLPAEQRRAAHRLLPGRGEDLQPVPPGHLPRQPGDRQPALERHLVRRRQPSTASS